jgi:hypothetical protein
MRRVIEPEPERPVQQAMGTVAGERETTKLRMSQKQMILWF